MNESGFICPLFTALSNNGIICKSHIDGAKSVEVRFQIKKNMETQIECFCRHSYKNCEHYLSYQHFLWKDE